MKHPYRSLRNLLILSVAAWSTAQIALAGNDTWTGGNSAVDSNWSDGVNWGGTAPLAGDSLFFDNGAGLLNTNDFAADTLFNGMTFNPTAGVFTLYGNSVVLSGSVAGATNGIANTSTVAQTVNLNLTVNKGYHTFSSTGGSTLALNGTVTNAPGGLAYFGANVTSTSFTSDSSGLISGLGAAGLMMTPDTFSFYGLAANNAGVIGDYVYAPTNVYSAAGIIFSGANNNIQLNPAANTVYTVATGSSLNTIVNTSGAFTATVTITNTLNMGPVGGFYVADGLTSAGGAANATKNLITINGAGSFLTAGGSVSGTPGTLIFAVNGTGTGNSMGVNPTSITNNGAGGAVTVIKTGSGSMFFQSVNGYSGGTYVNQGYLQANQATAANGFSSFGSGPVFIAAGATAFPNAGAGTWTNAFFLSPGLGYPTALGSIKSQAATYTGPFTLQGAATTVAGAGDRIDGANNGGTVTLVSQITGTGTLELNAQAGTVNWLLKNTNAAVNNWAGGVIVDNTAGNNSDLKLGANDQIPNGPGVGNVMFSQSGAGFARLDLNGFSDTINGLVSSGGSSLNQVGNFAVGTSTLTLGDNNTTASFDGVIGGGNSINIVKIGTGTQTLAGASTYTGNTIISNGVLALSGGGNLGNTVITVAGGAKFDVSQLSAFTLASGATLSGSGVVTGSVASASGSIITPGGASSLSFSNDLTLNAGSITTFNLSPTIAGANDRIVVAGNLVVSGGTIKILASTLQVGRYKLISFGTESGSAASLSTFYTGSQLVSLDDSIPGELDLVVQAGTVPSLTWKGDGTANNWDTTTLNWLNGATPAAYADGNFVTFNDTGSKSPAVNLLSTVQPTSLVVSNDTGTYTFAGGGNISGGASLKKQGTGALILNESGADSFSGGIQVSAGSLMLSNTTMNISGGISVANSTLVDVDNGTIGGGLTVSNGSASVMGNGTLNGNVSATNSTVYLAGQATINGNVINAGGTTTISNNVNIIGDVVVAGGTVVLDQFSIPTGNAIISSGVLQLGANDAFGNLPSGTITDNGVLVFNRTDIGLTLANVISGAGSLTQNGPGTVTLTAIETYTGVTTVNGGILVVNHGNSQPSTLTSSSALIINTNGSVQVGVDNSLAGSGGTLGALPVTINAGGSLTGLDGDDGGTGTSSHIRGLLTLNGGTLSNSGTSINTVHGSWNLDDNVAVNTGPNFATTSIINCQSVIPDTAGGTIFDVRPGSTPGGVDLLVTGTFINGSSTHDTGIIKMGAGTMVISNDVTDGQLNNYIGATIISNGVLRVDGSIDASAVTVTPGGTLSGSGSLGGAVTVNGTISPGRGALIGTLTCASSVTLSGTTVIKIDKTGGVEDKLSVGGALAYGGTLVVSNLSAAPVNGDSFPLFSAGTYSGVFASIVPAIPGAGLIWDQTSLVADGTLKVITGTISTPTTNANITAVSLTGTNLVVHGTNNNVPNTSFRYVVLSTTNLANPLGTWTPIATNAFKADGTFDYTNPVVPGTPKQFLDVQAVP